jgi:hypothetical protein
MNVRQLLSAIEFEHPTPCERHKCEKRDECGRDNLACTAFWLYVKTGRSHPPTLELNGRKAIWLREPLPSHAMYAIAMADPA